MTYNVFGGPLNLTQSNPVLHSNEKKNKSSIFLAGHNEIMVL